jgi:SCP-2 sterol transfer family
VLYLSPDWMEAARLAVAGDASVCGATSGIRLTVEHVVTGGPRGTIRWHIIIDDGAVALAAGQAVEPDLRFTTDYGTAAEIAAGELGAQRAFVEGRLRVGGDLGALIRHQKALSTIDDALAGVRARTQRT